MTPESEARRAGERAAGTIIEPAPSVYAETRDRQSVSALAAHSIGILPADLERLEPQRARYLALQRLREIEGVAELLSRQTDSLQAFLAALDGGAE